MKIDSARGRQRSALMTPCVEQTKLSQEHSSLILLFSKASLSLVSLSPGRYKLHRVNAKREIHWRFEIILPLACLVRDLRYCWQYLKRDYWDAIVYVPSQRFIVLANLLLKSFFSCKLCPLPELSIPSREKATITWYTSRSLLVRQDTRCHVT